MTVKRFPKKSDFVFLSALWDLVKNPRNGLLCGDKISRLMTENGFDSTYRRKTVCNSTVWSHPGFYGFWSVVFTPETETLWVMQADKDAWEDPLVLEVESPSEMMLSSVQ